MLSKEEIETCKKEARNYIEFMETAGDNAGWTRGLLWYIGQLETKTKELGKGQQELIKSRRKWKKRYYKIKIKNKDLQKSVEQIYDDYQDIGKIAFDYSDKIDQLESDKQKLIEKLEERIKAVDKCYNELLTDVGGIKIINVTGLTKKEKEEIINKRNCLLVQKYCYEEILEILKKE